MKKLKTSFAWTIIVTILSSCASAYDIKGTSNISQLDGRKLYLKILQNDEFKNIDSCDVVHGEFCFHGTMDTVRMANIFMDDEQLMPIVIEDGAIKVKVDDSQMLVTGSPLNETLYDFMKKYNQITAEKADLIHRHDQAIMNGSDMDATIIELQNDELRLNAQEDSLVTNFIRENYDNVLGPGVFFLITIGYQYPELTPWIEDIMSKATDKFKNDPYVSDFYRKAQENQQILNGLNDGIGQVPSAPVAPALPDTSVAPAPTPNEMAK